MPDTETNGSPSEASPPEALNDQVRDAVAQVQAMLSGNDGAVFQAAAYQTLAHSVSLAMQNAVAEQQQNQILRMALTSAAAKAILAGKKDEAESILELAEARLASPDLPALMAQVRELIQAIGSDLAQGRGETAAAAEAPAGGA